MQRWVYDQAWTSLRDAQERAIAPLLAGDQDVVIAAATASGKTEAAFLPICSVLASARETVEAGSTGGDGVAVLYLSPLKALINDQYGRLDELCERLGIPVTRWHGDVGAAPKQKLLKAPDGVLLITPESLESLFVNRGGEVPGLLAGLRYVVVDELHSFLATPRGAQLQSLLNRVEIATKRRPPRVGLSATLADMKMATAFLRPSHPQAPLVIASSAESDLKLQLRGYTMPAPSPNQDSDDDAELPVEGAIADDVFRHLRGTDNLVFANRRATVEQYAYLLSERCSEHRVPNEFWPHHGSLDRRAREAVERDLKDSTRPATAVCTSTLELGIDIGTVSSVAQIGPPPSVAAMRQRLGRSGRRGEAAVFRLYLPEPELDAKSSPVDDLRCDLIQSIAMVELLLERWLEPPDAPGLNLSTLVQQTLSLIAQHGGVSPADAHRVLCGPGPFEDVDPAIYARLLRSLAAADLVEQASDGTMLTGSVGERFLNHYSFYAAFETPEEWRLVADGRTLGTMPVLSAIEVGAYLLFSGRRWRIASVDAPSRVIDLVPAPGGKPPAFGGGGPVVSDGVRARMVKVYEGNAIPSYLDGGAQELLRQGRAAWRRLNLSADRMHAVGPDTLLWPWVGDPTLATVGLLLKRSGLDAGVEGPAVLVRDQTPDEVGDRLSTLVDTPRPSGPELAEVVENRAVEKWDWALSSELSCEAYAARFIQPERARSVLTSLLVHGKSSQEPLPAGLRRRTRSTDEADPEFCVIDIETTGFSPRLGDRVLELAAVRMKSNGETVDEWTTLVNPLRDVGPTAIHGVSAGELLEAPTFDEIAGDLLERMKGAVVVAHNLQFDWSFLEDEYEREGIDLPRLPGVCTLTLGSHLRKGMPKRRLAACCATFDVPLPAAHTALADARATAGLLKVYIDIAWRDGDRSLSRLGCEPVTWPSAIPDIPPTGKQLARAPGERIDRQGDYLADLVDSLGTGSEDADIAPYLEMLDRALEDRRLSDEESNALAAAAERLGLDAARVRSAHREYFRELVGVAMRDGLIGDSERRDLEDVGRLLGLDSAAELNSELSGPWEDPAQLVRASSQPQSSAGRSVCFTGQLSATLQGVPITRETASRLASDAGWEVQKRVTKALDVLVVADPDTQSGKAKQARRLGTEIWAESVFWSEIGVAVD